MSINSLIHDTKCPSLGYIQNPPRGYFKSLTTCQPVRDWTVQRNLLVKGNTVIEGNIAVTCDFSVGKNLTVGGTFEVTGATVFETISVTNDATICGTLMVDTLDVKTPSGPITVTPDFNVCGTLSVDTLDSKTPLGPITVTPDFNVCGILRVENCIEPKGMLPLFTNGFRVVAMAHVYFPEGIATFVDGSNKGFISVIEIGVGVLDMALVEAPSGGAIRFPFVSPQSTLAVVGTNVGATMVANGLVAQVSISATSFTTGTQNQLGIITGPAVPPVLVHTHILPDLSHAHSINNKLGTNQPFHIMIMECKPPPV